MKRADKNNLILNNYLKKKKNDLLNNLNKLLYHLLIL